MASSVIGSLRVNLGLDSGQLQRGLKQSGGKVKSFARNMRGALAGIAGGLSATAVVSFARKAADEIDRTAKAGRRLDTSVAGYRALELAASEAGVPLSQITDSVQTMDREIAKGSKNAVASLSALGLSAQDLAGLEADQKIALIADRVAELGLSSGEATALLQGLGVRSREMTLLVKGGGDALRKARQDVADYGLALADVDAAKIETANDRLGRLGLVSRYLGQQLAVSVMPALGAMAQAFTDSLREGGLLRSVLDGLATGVVRLSSYLTTFAALVGVRYVASMVAAAATSMTLVGALTAIRVALLRTGIGILIVGAGELVYQFLKVVSATGGIGNALKLLGDVTRDAWGNIRAHTSVMVANLEAGWKDVQAGAYDALAEIVVGGVRFANRFIGIFRGAFGAVKAVWGALPAAMGDAVYGAANITIKGIELMVKKAAGLIDDLTGSLAESWIGQKIGIAGSDLAGAIDFGGVKNPYTGKAKQLGQEAKDAFLEGYNADTFAQPHGAIDGLSGIGDDLRAQGEAYREAGRMLGEAAARPMTAWQRLKDLLVGTQKEIAKVPKVAEPASDALNNLGGAGKSAGAKLEEAANRGAQSLAEMFTGILKGSVSARDALIQLVLKIAEVQVMKGFKDLFGAGGGLSGFGSILGSLIGENAKGTNNWRGGLTSIHERGGEIVDLPSGTRIIPHDVSKRIVSEGGVGQDRLDVFIHPSGEFDTRTEGVAARVVAQATPQIVGASVGAARENLNENPLGWRR